LIELNRGLARLDLPDFELASRNDVDALGAFLEANGVTVVDCVLRLTRSSCIPLVNNNPETMDLGRRSFPTPAGWCFAPRPHAEEHRS
jgi:hypothetical protein